MINNVLEIKDLSIEFETSKGKTNIVENVNLNLSQGEVLGLLGESGCGKTTTSLAILNNLPNNGKVINGEILFKGKNILRLNKKELRKIYGKEIGIIPQNSISNLNPIRKIKSQFIESIKAHYDLNKEDAYNLACEMLSNVSLPDPKNIMNRFPFQLSGGMRQRVIIAMALSLKPTLLICDEPTTALDVTVESEILDIMNNIRKTYGTSIIFITHNLAILSKIADKVAIMYGGSIVEIGSIRQVIKSPNHPYTKALLNSIPKINESKRRLNVLKGSPIDFYHKPKGCLFYPRCTMPKEFCQKTRPTLKNIKGRYIACHNKMH